MPTASNDNEREQESIELLGLRLEPGRRGGYLVDAVRRGSGADQIGLARGDRLLAINGKALEGFDELRRSILALRGRTRAFIIVERGGGRYHVAIPLP